MHERTKYEKKPWYPGLQKKDRQIWDRFIAKYPNAYDEVIYNLHLGQGAEIPKGTSPELTKDFILLSQWKVDVVGFTKNEIHIIEVKPYAGANAIGQIVTYCEMYKSYIDPGAEPKAIIVTDALRPDVALLSNQLGFRVYVV